MIVFLLGNLSCLFLRTPLRSESCFSLPVGLPPSPPSHLPLPVSLLPPPPEARPLLTCFVNCLAAPQVPKVSSMNVGIFASILFPGVWTRAWYRVGAR